MVTRNCFSNNIIKTTRLRTALKAPWEQEERDCKMDRWFVIYFLYQANMYTVFLSLSLGLNAATHTHTTLDFGDSKFLIKICWYVFLRFFGIFGLCFFLRSTFDGRNITVEAGIEASNEQLGVGELMWAVCDKGNKWKIIKFLTGVGASSIGSWRKLIIPEHVRCK